LEPNGAYEVAVEDLTMPNFVAIDQSLGAGARKRERRPAFSPRDLPAP
jgi:hypothetical protein